MTQHHERPKVGIGVAVLHQGKILLGKRKGAHGSGEWAPPGGHLEFGETPEECARRELAEETGLIAVSIKPGPWTSDVIDKSKHYVTIFMFVESFVGIPAVLEPNKCESWEWFEWDKLPEPLFLPFRTLIQKQGLDNLKKL